MDLWIVFSECFLVKPDGVRVSAGVSLADFNFFRSRGDALAFLYSLSLRFSSWQSSVVMDCPSMRDGISRIVNFSRPGEVVEFTIAHRSL